MKVLKIITLVIFLASVPWAMWYNLNFDRYGIIDRPAPPVFIQVVTVDVGVFNNTLKTHAAAYSNRNHGVRNFVLPLNAEQIGLQEFDIRIIKDDGVFYAFISPTQTKEAGEHCRKFLEKLEQDNPNFKIHIG